MLKPILRLLTIAGMLTGVVMNGYIFFKIITEGKITFYEPVKAILYTEVFAFSLIIMLSFYYMFCKGWIHKFVSQE